MHQQFEDDCYKINTLVHILTLLKFNVVFDSSLPVYGRIYYSTKTIKLNEVDSKYILMIIMHEIGHYVGLRLLGIIYYLFFSKKLRELTAEIIGGIILALFQICCNSQQISIKDWIKIHE
jgi:hypothetical protein